jgi:hypothetical protein
MAIVSTGQLTLTDLNDSKQLVMYIGSSQSRTVIFNGVSTYVPNYGSANQVLTPQLFIAGTNSDIADQAVSCKWFYQINGSGSLVEITANTTDYTLTAIGSNSLTSLTIKTNLLASNSSMTYICELQYPDVGTGFNVTAKAEIEIVKVTNGTNGTNGTSGQNATIAILSNETDSVPSDSAGNNQIVTGVVSTVTVYEGTTDATSLWSMGTPVVVGATGTLSGSPANRTWTLNANGMTADVATVTWTLTRSGYANIIKTFTMSRVKNGVAGTSPTLYRLLSSSDVLQRSVAGVYNPTTLTASAKSQTGTGIYGAYNGRYQIWETVDGSTWGTVKYTSAGDEASKVWTPTAGIKGVKLQLYLAGGVTTLLDEQIVSVVQDGATGISAIVGVLSNDSHNLPSDSAGTVSTFANANSTLTIYEGATDVTALWTIAQTRTGTGLVVTEATTSRTATVTALGAVDTASITFTATRSGYSNVVKTFTLTKSKGGAVGANATAYWMTAPSAVVKSATGIYAPSTITVNGKSQVGAGTPANYSGRYIFADSPDGVTFTDRYTTPADIATYSYTPLANIKAVRVRFYLAGGVVTMLDEQVIPIVADGIDSIYAYVWTPDGNAIKNSTGTINVHVDIYSGSTSVTGTAFKWYIQDTTATTVSGGDTDGGNGWRLLNAGYNAGTTGYTTNTLVVPASAITGTESLKCVVTYNAIKYTGVTTVVDLSDPIIVRLDGVSVFKNGVGSTTITATVLQSGAEIDTGGSIYTYTWSIYDSTNVITAFAKTGKTITVNGTDVNSRGNLVCVISK